jgi:putative transcriptional regulator
MEIIGKSIGDERGNGCFEGQLLIAMPGLSDSNFARTVIYVCAHSDNGAMGFVLNRPQQLSFDQLLVQLDLIDESDIIALPDRALRMRVQTGGPVDTGRGFVLHSDNYTSQSTMVVADNLCVTATTDILRAISENRGPEQAIVMMGYSGWGAGQLESEISANGWLTCPGTADFIFSEAIDDKYDQAFACLGIDPAMLSSEYGQA